MFSKTCEYAIRAVMFIAQKTRDGSRVSVKEVAKGIDSPEYFIAKILQELGRKGLLQSAKGPSGGFYLDHHTLNQSLADIVRAVDGDKIFSGCGLGLKQCSESRPCPIHHQFKAIRSQLMELLEQSRIGSFSRELEAELTFLRR